jgi:hypothetical protein
MADVFLSYAREDAPRAEQIARGLQQAGLDVFWDNEIPPGATWADHIEQKLTQCKALIVLWSEHSTKSQWVREEARMGRDKGVLIPVMIDASRPPFGFGEVQAANLSGWTGAADDANWRRFLDAVLRFSQNAPRPAPTPVQPPASPRAAAQPASSWSAPAQTESKKGVPTWAWIAGGVGAVALLFVVAAAVMENQQAQLAQPAPTPAQAAVSAPSPAGDSPQAVILAQLQQAQAALAQQGFQMVGQPYSGGLAQGQTWNVPAELHPGYDYRVIGVCDRDCADLDLVLFDPNGALLTQDTTTTSQPIVGIQPAYVGMFTIQVQMYNCAVAPCYYAIALYGRPM